MRLEKPIDGTCCSCGYSGADETPCLKREDGTHCEHWCDGPSFTCSECEGLCGEDELSEQSGKEPTTDPLCIDCAINASGTSK